MHIEQDLGTCSSSEKNGERYKTTRKQIFLSPQKKCAGDFYYLRDVASTYTALGGYSGLFGSVNKEFLSIEFIPGLTCLLPQALDAKTALEMASNEFLAETSRAMTDGTGFTRAYKKTTPL